MLELPANVLLKANVVDLADGAFAEHIQALGDVQMKIPDNISDAEAAAFPVSVTTAGMALYQELGLPFPSEPVKESFPILIYGGSSSVGATAIQLAKK